MKIYWTGMALLLLAVGFGAAALVEAQLARSEREDGNRAIDGSVASDVWCHEQCTAAGYPSLNAFFSPRHFRCMCQDTAAHGHVYNDVEGYRILLCNESGCR